MSQGQINKFIEKIKKKINAEINQNKKKNKEKEKDIYFRKRIKKLKDLHKENQMKMKVLHNPTTTPDQAPVCLNTLQATYHSPSPASQTCLS